MTFSKADMEFSNNHLYHASELAKHQADTYPEYADGLISSVASMGISAIGKGWNWMRGNNTVKEPEVYPNGLLRASIIRAESQLLSGMLYLFQESVVGLMKAGWKMRKGYKEYEWVWKNVKHLVDMEGIVNGKPNPNLKGPKLEDVVDKHTLGGVYFGIGMFNLTLSTLPPKMLNVVKFLGFECDRKLGLALLEKANETENLRCATASLALLTYYGMFSAFAPHFLGQDYIPLANRILDSSLERFPRSSLHLYMAGRIKRLAKNVQGSIDEGFDKAIAAFQDDAHKDEYKPMKHLCWYELGLSYMSLLNFEKAKWYFESLMNENYWSQKFYCFMVAACYDMLQDRDNAIVWLEKLKDLKDRKIAGKTMGVDLYVHKKGQLYLTENKAWLGKGVMGWEILTIWNCFAVMDRTTLDLAKTRLETLLQVEFAKKDAKVSDNLQATILLAYSEVLRELYIYQLEGKEASRPSTADSKSSKSGGTKSLLRQSKEMLEKLFVLPDITETWIRPFAMYNSAVVYYVGGNSKKAQSRLEAVRTKYHSYEFEFRCEMRVQLALSYLEEKEEGSKK